MKTPAFEGYREKYENVRMRREDGVLEVALHTRGGPLEFNGYVHEALVQAFRDIGDDRDNHVVILTGMGDDFCTRISAEGFDFFTPSGYDKILREGTKILENLLDIEVPIIAAINGPVSVHSGAQKYALLCDIVLASRQGCVFSGRTPPGVRHRPGGRDARPVARGHWGDSRAVLSAEWAISQRGRSKGLRRRQRGHRSRGPPSPGMGIGATSQEAAPAHAAVHPNGAFDPLSPPAPGELVLRARARGNLGSTGRGIECAKTHRRISPQG